MGFPGCFVFVSNLILPFADKEYNVQAIQDIFCLIQVFCIFIHIETSKFVHLISKQVLLISKRRSIILLFQTNFA